MGSGDWYALRCAMGMLGGYPPHPPTKALDDVPRNPFLGYGPVHPSCGRDGSFHLSRLQMRVEGSDVVFYVLYRNELTLIEQTRFARRDAVKLALDTLLLHLTATLRELWLRLRYSPTKTSR